MFRKTKLDQNFKQVLEKFDGTTDSPYYEQFFKLLLEGAKANVIKMLNSRAIKGKNSNDYGMDAVLKVLPRLLLQIQNGIKPEFGPVYLTYFAAQNVLFNDSEKQKDRELLMEDLCLLENY